MDQATTEKEDGIDIETISITSTDPAILRARIKIPHADCQQMVLDGVLYLAAHSPQTVWRAAAVAAASDTQPANAFRRMVEKAAAESKSPDVQLVEQDSAFTSLRTPLLIHLAQRHPNELNFLLYRISQHALYLHAFGWSHYANGFRLPPTVPLVQSALAECHQSALATSTQQSATAVHPSPHLQLQQQQHSLRITDMPLLAMPISATFGGRPFVTTGAAAAANAYYQQQNTASKPVQSPTIRVA